MTATPGRLAAPPYVPAAGRGESLGSLALRRLLRDRRAVAGLVILLALSLASALAPLLAPYDRDATDVLHVEEPPSAAHLLGTDELGRDVLSRLLWGGRVSLSVGVVSVTLSVGIGTVLGALAGYYGGWVDAVVMRLADMVLAFPFFPLALTLSAVLGPSIYNTMIVIGALSWTGVARLVRGEFLSLRGREFVQAAAAMGAPDRRIIARHLLPGAAAPLLVAATLGMASAILGEAGLSFLGLGVPQPVPSWGNMLSGALSYRVLLLEPWLWVPPGVLIFLAVLSINLVGDGLRDALDPRLNR